jgi:hypothetical protein
VYFIQSSNTIHVKFGTICGVLEASYPCYLKQNLASKARSSATHYKRDPMGKREKLFQFAPMEANASSKRFSCSN